MTDRKDNNRKRLIVPVSFKEPKEEENKNPIFRTFYTKKGGKSGRIDLDDLGKIVEEMMKDFEKGTVEYERYVGDLDPNNPDNWKVPKEEPVPKNSPEEILAPLDKVFLEDTLKDQIIIRVGIPELIEGKGKDANYGGVILHGPPGTGKTILQKAMVEVFRNAGAYAKEVSISEMNSMWVGSFARNVENEIVRAIEEGRKRNKPSHLCFDEASVLVQQAAEGAYSVAKHYQETIDVIKRYSGNFRELTMTVSTNLLSAGFEEALTREGRLTTFFIGYPDAEQRRKMWDYFMKVNKIDEIIKPTPKQLEELASLTGEQQGAFVEEFCRNYDDMRRAELLKAKGYNTLLDALKHKANVSEQAVRESINYEQFVADLKTYLQTKSERKNAESEETNKIGFKAEQ